MRRDLMELLHDSANHPSRYRPVLDALERGGRYGRNRRRILGRFVMPQIPKPFSNKGGKP